jgi:F0F1-type ATP synthase assembly protein I
MGKAAKRARKTTSAVNDPTQDYMAVIQAKQQFVGTAINMGWRLALMVLIPIFIGLWLDKRFDTAPSITLAAFFIALFGAGVMIYRTYKELMADVDMSTEPRVKRLKRNKNA